MTRYVVQSTRQQVPDIGLEKIDRLDVNALLDCLTYPVVWTFDEYLNAWIVGEIDDELVQWLTVWPYKNGYLRLADQHLWSQTRQKQLLRAGLLAPTGRIPMSELFAKRRVDKLVKIPQLLSSDYVGWLDEFFSGVKMERWRDMEGISRGSINDHPLMRLIHSQLLFTVEAICAQPLKPSYSFTAIYDGNSNLPKHTDRPQCMINISILFGGTPVGTPLSTWPLNVDVEGTVHTLALEAGDGGLYSGTAHPHWRETMTAPLQTVSGAFLHFVRRDFQGKLT